MLEKSGGLCNTILTEILIRHLFVNNVWVVGKINIVKNDSKGSRQF